MKHRLPLCLAVIVGASALCAEPVPDDTPQPANAIAASAPSITDEIQFFNHDKLHGTFLGYDKQGGVHWQGLGSKAPIVFQTANIVDIALDSHEPPAITAHPTHLVTLTNDDELRGVPISLDDQALVLDTWYAGKLAIVRSMIRSITALPTGANAIYEGPTGMDGWTTNPDVPDAGIPNRGILNFGATGVSRNRGWLYRAGAFIANDYGIVGRDVKLPDVASVEFDLVTGGSAQVTIGLYADQVNDAADCYVFRINGGFIFIRRSLKSGVAGTGPIELPGDPMQRRKLHIDIRVNRKTRTCRLFANGALLKQWVDPAEFAGKGTSLMFICHRGTYACVRDITVATWDGKTAAGNVSAVESDEDYIVMENMDALSGKLKAITKGKVKFSSPYADLDIPIERIAIITMQEKTTTPVAGSAEDIRGWFPGRGSVTMELESWDGKQVIASSPNFVGKAIFSPDAFQRLQFNLGRQPASDDASPEKSQSSFSRQD